MSALGKMREAFETCTVMAGVEPDFECIYITKDAANALFDEAEAENAKLRELVRDVVLLAGVNGCDVTKMQMHAHGGDWRTIWERMSELCVPGAEVGE